ncbi:MAG: alpha/beta hydrolase [Propionibacteriaceae bacterium]|nr:alpha/beta hydrolase [Propionibacteriaceae bacterium]
MSRRDVQVPGGVYCHVWEPEDPVGTVLAVHGITSSSRAWEPLARHLPEWRIVAPDLRGRGQSNTLSGPYGMARHADDVAAALDHLGIEHALPVGHSMGGFVVVTLAHRRPDLMDRLVLVDGGLPLPMPEGLSADDALHLTLGPAAQRLSRTFDSPEQYIEFWQQHPAFSEWNEDVERYVRYDLQGDAAPYRPATSYEAMAGDYHDLIGAECNEFLEALTNLAVPATFLRAPRGMIDDPGGLFSAEYAAEWAAKLPGLAVVNVPGVNHYTITLSDHGAAAVADAVQKQGVAS